MTLESIRNTILSIVARSFSQRLHPGQPWVEPILLDLDQVEGHAVSMLEALA
jgi:hypothetical protein